MYSEIVIDHFVHPRSVGIIEKPDGFGKAGGGPRCPHDLAYVWIQVIDGCIKEIRHKTLGCPVSIAASSLTCEMARGRTVTEAMTITPQKIIDALGDVPEHKADSAVGPQALQRAIADYRARGN